MATLTIRRLDDKVVEDFKRIAKKNNRSAEAQARSLIEDFTAGVLAHDIMSNSDFGAGDVGPARRRILQSDEELAPPRTDDARPIELG